MPRHFGESKRNWIKRLAFYGTILPVLGSSSNGGATTKETMSGPSNGSARPGPVEAVSDMRRRLALVEQERRQAVYEARDAEGDRPTLPGIGRDKLPTLDDLTDSGPTGRIARWKLVLAAVAAASTIAGAVCQLVELFR